MTKIETNECLFCFITFAGRFKGGTDSPSNVCLSNSFRRLHIRVEGELEHWG